ASIRLHSGDSGSYQNCGRRGLSKPIPVWDQKAPTCSPLDEGGVTLERIAPPYSEGDYCCATWTPEKGRRNAESPAPPATCLARGPLPPGPFVRRGRAGSGEPRRGGPPDRPHGPGGGRIVPDHDHGLLAAG